MPNYPAWRNRRAMLIGIACLYIFQTLDALFTGAVVVLGVYCARRAVLEEGRFTGSFSLWYVFEFAVAVAVVLIVSRINERWLDHAFGLGPSESEDLSPRVILGALYVAKIAITYVGHSKKHLAVNAYLVAMWACALLLGSDLVRGVAAGNFSLHAALIFAIDMFLWLPVPTVSFFSDLKRAQLPPLRLAIWRAVGEFTILVPIWYCLGVVVVVFILFQLGPFRMMWP